MPLLLRAEGPGWSVEVFGDIPELPPFVRHIPDAGIRSTGAVSRIEVYSPLGGEMIPVVQGDRFAPIFFEAIPYDIHFEMDSTKSEITLPPAAKERRKRAGSCHYTLDFGSNVGWWDIGIKAEGGAAIISAEVFSRKVDYRTDYLTMREDVSGILRNLAMTASAKTYGTSAPDPHSLPTLNEWFALIKAHFDELEALSGSIARHPHSKVERIVVPVDAQRARKVSRSALERGLRRPKAGLALPGSGVPIAGVIGQQVTSLTYDTAENRYFKGVLTATRKRVRALVAERETGDEDADKSAEAKFFERIRPDLEAMGKRIDALLNAPFLKSVGQPTLTRPSSMVLYRHPAYSRFDRLARLLCGGLSFAGGSIPIGVKDTALLYEYWCFLKIVQTMRTRLDLVSQSIVKIKRFKTTVTLAKGRPAALQFQHKASGKTFYVVYNRLFNRLPTLAQKPDNVIQLASEEQMYILDAKYRVQFDRQYVAQNGGPGPTADDINTMHRYRDAIVLPHPLRPGEYKTGVVIGAAVLFPLPDEETYRQHRFYNSLDAVEIGGIPLLPQTSKLFEEKLEKILNV